MTEDISRRTLLRNGSAGLATIGIAGLAGCTSDLPIIGDDGGSGPDVEQWLVAPSFGDIVDQSELRDTFEGAEVEDSELGTRYFRSVVPEALFDNEDETNPYSTLETGSETRSRVGVSATDVEWQLVQGLSFEYDYSYSYGERSNRAWLELATLSGSFDPDAIESNLERWADEEYGDDDEELSSEGSYEEFDCYEIDDMGFAVHEDYVIEVDGDSYVDAVAVLEAAIDARWSEENRWTDDEDAAELLSELEVDDTAGGSVFDPQTVDTAFEDRYGDQYDDIDDLPESQREDLEDRYDDWETGMTAMGSSHAIDGGSTEIANVFVYESESNVDVEAVRDHVDANRDIGDRWATLEDYSVSADGRVAVLTGTVRTRSLFSN